VGGAEGGGVGRDQKGVAARRHVVALGEGVSDAVGKRPAGPEGAAAGERKGLVEGHVGAGAVAEFDPLGPGRVSRVIHDLADDDLGDEGPGVGAAGGGGGQGDEVLAARGFLIPAEGDLAEAGAEELVLAVAGQVPAGGPGSRGSGEEDLAGLDRGGQIDGLAELAEAEGRAEVVGLREEGVVAGPKGRHRGNLPLVQRGGVVGEEPAADVHRVA